MRMLMGAAAVAAVVVAAAPALAHTGGAAGAGFGHGVAHPLFGLDHLLAMLAVGLWAGQSGGRARWTVPAAFVAMMLAGGVLGMAGVGLPAVEPLVAASVLVLGLLILTARRLPPLAGAAVVGAFALFHGHAHGAELPAAALPALYAAGFVAATAALHAAGLGAATLLRGLAVRAAGAGIAVVGAALSFA